MIDRLPERMEHIISMVSKGESICDVGCDHGYISIALVKRNIAVKALAMDINKGPLNAASYNIKKDGLDDRIITRLSDGLDNYNIGEATTLIIAGMGGPLMCDILSKHPDYTHDFKELILSPQSKIPEFRKFLYDNGYKIVDEDMVFEDGKYYVIIKAVFDKNTDVINEREYRLGPVLLKKKHDVLKEYIIGSLNKNKKILNDLKCIKTDNNADRINQLTYEIDILNEGLNIVNN